MHAEGVARGVSAETGCAGAGPPMTQTVHALRLRQQLDTLAFLHAELVRDYGVDTIGHAPLFTSATLGDVGASPHSLAY